MLDRDTNLRTALKTATISVCSSWDIQIHDSSNIHINTLDGDGEFEALVPVAGRVLLDDLTETQGRLLGIKDGIAIELAGFQNDRLLLSLDLDTDDETDTDNSTEAEEEK